MISSKLKQGSQEDSSEHCNMSSSFIKGGEFADWPNF